MNLILADQSNLKKTYYLILFHKFEIAEIKIRSDLLIIDEIQTRYFIYSLSLAKNDSINR